MRSFLRFCQDSGWIGSNPAMVLKPPKVSQRPTLPFEMARSSESSKPLTNSRTADRLGQRLALWCCPFGMPVSECRTRRVSSDIGSKRTSCSCTRKGPAPLCTVRFPPTVVEALKDVSNAHPKYFFWDGRSKRETTVKSWNRVSRKIFATADPAIKGGGHLHRFRDTFAVSLLLSGVELFHVSILLGHASIKITERHYAPWVKARQKQLEDDVRRTWGSLDLLDPHAPAPDDTSAPQPTAAP
jgi:integrase/recombinase XerD